MTLGCAQLFLQQPNGIRTSFSDEKTDSEQLGVGPRLRNLSIQFHVRPRRQITLNTTGFFSRENAVLQKFSYLASSLQTKALCRSPEHAISNRRGWGHELPLLLSAALLVYRLTVPMTSCKTYVCMCQAASVTAQKRLKSGPQETALWRGDF